MHTKRGYIRNEDRAQVQHPLFPVGLWGVYLWVRGFLYRLQEQHPLLCLKVFWWGVLGICFLQPTVVMATPEADDEQRVSTSTPYTVPRAIPPIEHPGKSRGQAKYALLISLDGVSYDAIHRVIRNYPGTVPHMRRLMKRGFLRPLQGVFPTMTWVNHVSMVTGQYPRHHGVLGNRWLEDFEKLIYPYTTDIVEDDRYVRTPALYDLAKERGWKTAALNWPGTQKAKHIHYNLPEIMGISALSYRYASPAMRNTLMQMWNREYRGTSSPARSERELQNMLGQMAVKERIEMDMLMRDLAVRLVRPAINTTRRRRSAQAQRDIPRLMLLHFLLPDSLLHKYGPTPWLERWGLEQMDGLIGSVIRAYQQAKIWNQTVVFITSDHGFSRITHTLDIRQLLIDAGLSRYRGLGKRNRTREKVMAFTNGHSAFLYIRRKDRALVPKVIQALQHSSWRDCMDSVLSPPQFANLGLPYPENSAQNGSNGSLRAGYHAGTPTLIAVSRPHCLFSTDHRQGRILNKYQDYSFGGHGYFAHHRSMKTFLLGAGPGIRTISVRPPNLKNAYTVDIAPTLAHLMGLSWPKTWESFAQGRFLLDGRVLLDILRDTKQPPRNIRIATRKRTKRKGRSRKTKRKRTKRKGKSRKSRRTP